MPSQVIHLIICINNKFSISVLMYMMDPLDLSTFILGLMFIYFLCYSISLRLMVRLLRVKPSGQVQRIETLSMPQPVCQLYNKIEKIYDRTDARK